MVFVNLNPLSPNPTKGQTQNGQTLLPTNCLSVFNYFVGLALKGYLRYKTITSQNVSSEAQIKNFFIL